jgi:hypothetical protein
MFLVLLSLILPASGLANTAGQTDYTHCNTHPLPFGGMVVPPAFRIGSNGSLEFDKKGPLVKKHSRESGSNKETLELQLNNPSGKGNDSHTIILHSKDGRPVSLEQIFRIATRTETYVDGTEVKHPAWEMSSGTRFAHDANGKCFVRQMYSAIEGKEIIKYDSEACADLLAVYKKIGKKKLRECSETLQQMSKTLQKHEAKAAKEEKQLRMGVPGKSDWELQDSSNFNSLTAAGMCQLNLALYGKQVPSEESLLEGPSLSTPPQESQDKEAPTTTAE